MCIYVCLWDGAATGTWKGRGRSKGLFEVLASVAETRLESFEGTPGRSEKKLESRTSLQTEDIARDSFFSARVEEVCERGDRHVQMIFLGLHHLDVRHGGLADPSLVDTTQHWQVWETDYDKMSSQTRL